MSIRVASDQGNLFSTVLQLEALENSKKKIQKRKKLSARPRASMEEIRIKREKDHGTVKTCNSCVHRGSSTLRCWRP